MIEEINVIELIRPELLVLVPVLNAIGFALKKSKIDNAWIPFLLGFCGILLATVYMVATEPFSDYRSVASAIFAGITQGVLAASVAVYANQALKQLSNLAKRDEDNDQ